MKQNTNNYRIKNKAQWKVLTAQLFRFGVVGVLATALHYGVYLLLMPLLKESIAYSIGYLISFVCNFILTCIFTFKKKANKDRGLGFCVSHVINYCLQIFLLKYFLYVGVAKAFAPIPVYIIAVPVNFLMVRYVFFRSKNT